MSIKNLFITITNSMVLVIIPVFTKSIKKFIYFSTNYQQYNFVFI